MLVAERPPSRPVEECHPWHCSPKYKPVVAIEPFSIIMMVTYGPSPSLSSSSRRRVRSFTLTAVHRTFVRRAVELISKALAATAFGPAAMLRAEPTHYLI